MKTLETGEEKIQEICSAIRKEALEPAHTESAKIIAAAEERARSIVHGAEKDAEKLLQHAKEKIEQERNVFESSLLQASKQCVEALKQSIENRVFNEFLEQEIKQATVKPDVIAKIVQALIHAVEKEGIKTDFTAVIPKTASAEEVSRLLASQFLKALNEGGAPFLQEEFLGGAKLKVHNKKMTVEMTDRSLKDLLSHYVRKDFRKLIYG